MLKAKCKLPVGSRQILKANIRHIMSMQNNNTETSETVCEITHVENASAVSYATRLLQNNHVIALATDTVYGLACSANDPNAIQRLYSIKGRKETKPIAICVADIDSLRRWGEANHLKTCLLTSLLPGPVTVVLRKSKNLDNPFLNPGVENIGIRIPDFPFIQKVCANFNLPMALTSANRSNAKSTLNINEFRDLWPSLEAVFDGGQLGVTESQRSASTVIDLSKPGRYKIIREGVAVSKTIEIMKKYEIVEENV